MGLAWHHISSHRAKKQLSLRLMASELRRTEAAKLSLIQIDVSQVKYAYLGVVGIKDVSKGMDRYKWLMAAISRGQDLDQSGRIWGGFDIGVWVIDVAL